MYKAIILFLCIPLWTHSNAYAQISYCSGISSLTTNPNSGFSNITEIHYGAGLGKTTSGEYARQYYGFTSIFGYRLNIHRVRKDRSINAGIGTGAFIYEAGMLVPLFLDIRYSLDFMKLSPFIFEDGGGLIKVDNPIDGSQMFINLGAGISRNISRHMAITLGGGLMMQMSVTNARDSFVNMRLGIMFKP